jgi:hypothetical protein
MSWSILLIGKSENVVKALEAQSAKLGDPQSRKEFDEAKPHLIGLVSQNFAKEGSSSNPPIVKLTANGHGISRDGIIIQSSLNASVESIYGELV